MKPTPEQEAIFALEEVRRKLWNEGDSTRPIWCRWCLESKPGRNCTKCFRMEVIHA